MRSVSKLVLMAVAASLVSISTVAAQEVDGAALVAEGGAGYKKNCVGCHGEQGQGGDGPKLAGNPFVRSPSSTIQQILKGFPDHGMPPFADVLSDRDIAAIASYVRASWGNSFPPVQPDVVRTERTKQ
jgi:mono/diheme cytochrome c family protein